MTASKRKAPSGVASADNIRNVRPKKETSDVQQELLSFQLKALAYLPIHSDFFQETARSAKTQWTGSAADLSKAMLDNGASVAAVETLLLADASAAARKAKITSYMKKLAPRLHSYDDARDAIIGLLAAMRVENPDTMNSERAAELEACVHHHL